MSTTVIPGSALLTDAFGSSRGSSPKPIYASKFLFDEEPLRWNTVTTGLGAIAYDANRSTVRLLVGTGATDSVTRQSKVYIDYTPGTSQLLFVHGSMAGVISGLVQEFGLFDSENGVFFQADGDQDAATFQQLAFVRRSKTSGSVADDRIPQADWNIDKLNGLGPSGITLVPSNIQALLIDWQWPSGRIRLGFHINGVPVYAHQYFIGNVIALPWATSPKLPFRYTARKTGLTAAGAELAQVAVAAFVEGQTTPLGQIRSYIRRNPGQVISSTNWEPVISVRLNPTSFKATLQMLALTVGTSTSGDFFWALLINPTYTTQTVAPVWTALPNSRAQFDVTRDATISEADFQNQIIVDSGYGDATQNRDFRQLEEAILLASNIDGTVPDIATIVALNQTGGSETYFASLTWRELT